MTFQTSEKFVPTPADSRRYYGSYFPKLRTRGGKEIPVKCLFPWHQDDTASASVNLAKGTWFCHACNIGGGILDFQKTLTGKSEKECWDAINSIIGRAGNNHQPEPRRAASDPRIVATYDYHDADGNVVHQTVREEPKKFKQRRPDGKGGWIWNLDGVTPVLYDLPGVMRANRIAITEGEKDKHAFDKAAASFPDEGGRLIYCGTSNAMGAGKWREEYSPSLAGKISVHVCEDNDDAGRRHAQQVCVSASKYAQAVYLVTFRDLPEHGDLSEYLKTHTPAELYAYMQAAPRWMPPAGVSSNGAEMPFKPKTDVSPFKVRDDGVFYFGMDREGKAKPELRICDRLDILAQTRDGKSCEWGRLLKWQDNDKVIHTWAMPMEALQSDGATVRSELASMGLSIAPGKPAHELLLTYLQTWPVDGRTRCVDRLGWHGPVYVGPSETIGEHSEEVVFQNVHALEPAFSTSGTTEEWRDHVAAMARGNSRMVFALSVAFAGPLIEPAAEDSGGFHLRGTSSTGKSTALRLAASVWGNPSHYCRLWRVTSNGLEGLAALHNDGVLILDELGQVDPREAGEAAYMLANGRGKARAARDGTARQSATWRLFFFSAGEESLSTLMAQVGKKATAGQEIRLADIDADAGAGMGALECLNGCASSAALAATLKDAAGRYYGSVGADWLRWLVQERLELPAFIHDGVRQFVEEHAAAGTGGQVERVARRFGLVAVAGELATHAGLTGWQKGDAEQAAGKCYAAWREFFGGGKTNREERALLAQVKQFFELHGASRFESVVSVDNRTVPNRAGFYRCVRDGEQEYREFLVLPEIFKTEVCKGFDPKAAVKVLRTQGWLIPGSDRNQQKCRLPDDIGLSWAYVIGEKMWGYEE